MVGKTDHVSIADQLHISSAKDGQKSSSTGFRGKLQNLTEKLTGSSLDETKAKLINQKHSIGKYASRHDEPHEQATDAKRTKIAEQHRFQSFAPERDGNIVRWYIDGRDYFHALSLALEAAQETIYIMDWWLSPELFLQRPPINNQKWRLDQVLKRAAERGVKIYVILYREVENVLSCNSAHSKHVLEALCPPDTPGHGNIRVQRHPDHNSLARASDLTLQWAHHSKVVVIDYDTAFIGGLDACMGRWDTITHGLACCHPGGVASEVWPGQDFNNNRIADFKSVDQWKDNEVSKSSSGRMPWHDVHMGLVGPSVYDIAEQFVLRWNFIKRDKYKRDEDYDWLTLTGRTGDDEDLVGVQRPKHPVGDYVHHPLSPLENKRGNPEGSLHDHGSHALTENDQALRRSEEQVDEHGYTSEQHKRGHGLQKDFRQFSERHHLPLLHHKENDNPELAGSHQEEYKHTGNHPKKQGMVTASGGVQEKSKGYSSEVVGQNTPDTLATVHAQVVRSAADWSSGILTESSIQNACCQVIREAKHFVYIENQFFITATGDEQHPVANLIGAAIVDAVVKAGKEGRKFRVLILLPCIPGFAGDLRADEAIGTRAIMDYQYKSICRGPESIMEKVRSAGVDPTQHIFLFNLRSYDRINFTDTLAKKEKQSGVKYVEVQRAHAEEIMTTGLHHTSSAGTKDEIKLSEKAQQERDEVIARRMKFEGDATDDNDQHKQSGDPGSVEVGRDPVSGSRDTIAGNAMLDGRKVSEEPWAGRGEDGPDAESLRENEVNHFIQEELYIHSKLLIVDDRIVICGSSNINDRSQLGFHDSELSIVMEDTRPLESKMDGQPFTAGYHASSLRRMLWREHLGLLRAQPIAVADDDPNARVPGDGENFFHQGDEWDKFVEDPLSEDLWKMWTDRATVNTKVFRHLFHADPDDSVLSFEDYDKYLGKQGSREAGHLFDLFAPVDIVRKELDKIKGHLVWMPLNFLRDANMAEKGLQINSFTESIYT